MRACTTLINLTSETLMSNLQTIAQESSRLHLESDKNFLTTLYTRLSNQNIEKNPEKIRELLEELSHRIHIAYDLNEALLYSLDSYLEQLASFIKYTIPLSKKTKTIAQETYNRWHGWKLNTIKYIEATNNKLLSLEGMVKTRLTTFRK